MICPRARSLTCAHPHALTYNDSPTQSAPKARHIEKHRSKSTKCADIRELASSFSRRTPLPSMYAALVEPAISVSSELIRCPRQDSNDGFCQRRVLPTNSHRSRHRKCSFPCSRVSTRSATMSTANVAVRYCPIESIPPVHFGEVCVEFERLDVASSRNRHSSRNDVDPTNIAFKLTKGTDHDTQRVSAIETTQNMLNIDDVGEVYVSGSENNTVHIIPQDRSPSVRNCDNYETPRFAFSDRVLTLINLSREFPRIGVVLADGTLHLLVRMRMMPWILGDTIKPDFPKFDCESLSVSYSVAHNCLLWLFQRLEQNRAKHKLSFELWVHHLNWPVDLLIRSKRRPDYMLAQGLPGPGRVMAFSCHMLMFFSNGVLSLPFSEVRFDPIPTSEALKTRHAPEVQLWQPGQRRATTLDLNQLQLRSQFRLWLRGVFHNVQREFGVAIFGDLCFKFTVRAHGLHCEPMFYLANVQSPLAESRAPLRFIFDEQDNGVLILHDGSYLCVVHRSFTRGNCEYDMSFRGIPGTLVPADGVPTAIFRALGAPPLTVRVVKNYMAKNGTYM